MTSLVGITGANLSCYSVPAALILSFIPHLYANTIAGANYDVAEPRKILASTAADESLEKKVRERIRRAKAAHDNAIESIGLYAGGIAVANLAKIDKESLNQLSVAYISLRIVYTFVYVVLQDNRKWAPVRSLLWVASIGVIFTLWIRAGNALN